MGHSDHWLLVGGSRCCVYFPVVLFVQVSSHPYFQIEAACVDASTGALAAPRMRTGISRHRIMSRHMNTTAITEQT